MNYDPLCNDTGTLDEPIIIKKARVTKTFFDPILGNVSFFLEYEEDDVNSTDEFLERFDKRNSDLRDVLKAKGSDYSGDEDRHRNFKLMEYITCGKPIKLTPLVSCLTRQLDKIQRAINLILNGKEHVKGETMKDTLMDNIGYANIAMDIWECEEHGDKKEALEVV